MPAATDTAAAATLSALDVGSGVDLAVAGDLFAVARTLSENPNVGSAMADWATPAAAREQLVRSVFGAGVSETAVGIVVAAARERWSSVGDLVAGIEDVAVRAAARADRDADVEGELFRFSRVVASRSDLELALGSRLGDDAVKGDLVTSLLRDRASDATVLIVSSLVRDPRGRRVRRLLIDAERSVAADRGRVVARVTAAVPLDEKQQERLRTALKRRYGLDVSLNTVLDPAVVGGMRVQIGDEVIDGSVASRLTDLRQRLAG